MNEKMNDGIKQKRRPGRKPMTAEEKASAASEVDLDTLVEAAKAGFRQEKKRTPITDLKLYVKPEERTAYYVVNETFNGSVAF